MAADCVNQRPEEYITEQGLDERYLIPPQNSTTLAPRRHWAAILSDLDGGESLIASAMSKRVWPPERSTIVPTNRLDGSRE
jgi:hypothetical protein